MKILFINSVCGIRSTGRICAELARQLEERGHECRIAYGRVEDVPPDCRHYAVKIGTGLDVKLHAVRSMLLDDHGFGSGAATRRFLEWAEDYNPDLVWLHNIHGYYLNIELLFAWLKKRPQTKVFWTLHDCWSFTGHCSHFDYVGCERWLEGCHNCPQKKEYPRSLLLDRSKRNWQKKQALFTSLPKEQMQLFTPSDWLAGVVRRSYMGKYPVRAMPNGIDTEVFRPMPSDLRSVYGLTDKKIALGAATTWYDRKGYDIFLELADLLDDSWRIVLIGVSPEQKKQLPGKILGLERTNSTEELAKWYTAADVFVNPSFEETMGLTTVEALACGTPAIVFDRTALPEVLDETCGMVLSDCSAKGIAKVMDDCVFESAACIRRAQDYDKKKRYRALVDFCEQAVAGCKEE